MSPLRRFKRSLLALFGGFALWAGPLAPAHALPSFARQTGMDCAACHVGAFGPQLTPLGMRFKMDGYTDSDGKEGHVPLSAMLIQTYTHTSKDQPGDAAPHFDSNNNASLQEVSGFFAGGIGEHFGGLLQATYSEPDRRIAWDNTDLRLVNKNFSLGGSNATVGLSLNNNPTVQDPFNSTPAWRFPFVSSELVPGQAAAPLLDGGLAQQVLGLTAYTFWNNSVYAELGAYNALSKRFLLDANVLATGDPLDKLDNPAPYWRLAYFKDLRSQAWSVGLFGMNADMRPEGLSGHDNYNDIGVDANYQFLGSRKHVFSANAAYLHERRKLDATFADGGADNANANLDQFRLSGSYYYDKTYGLTLGWFDTRGDRDTTLYGTRTGKPDTSGATLQADWTPFGKEDSWGAPWANLRLGAQYTWYDKFNGASSNYDGTGRNASDNDTLFMFVWAAF